ncbi:hypothetical protein GTU71_02495 [Rathayibacter sp. VKM Ac-2762]|uniref:hypothetical protein n=1 Tax=Rathayibacter sp. VKM Ac-2762 TaxID=2609254 RepID=UPI00132EFB4B|nr:hypothetical protein [Rathayibacter sp. VKM Ac-2762]QHF19838.1 hypothetical protein GTU71_02495 [Rathayibacter sp. VKM Ac-2762]
MTDGPTFDFTAFDALTADLGQVPRNTGPNLRKAGEVFARKVRDAWRTKLAGATALPSLGAAVTYDVRGTVSAVSSELELEIGPEPNRRQGRLDNISEFGSPTVAPRGYGLASLRENEEDLARGVDLALREAERAAGL